MNKEVIHMQIRQINADKNRKGRDVEMQSNAALLACTLYLVSCSLITIIAFISSTIIRNIKVRINTEKDE
jgi:hypothetical protein